MFVLISWLSLCDRDPPASQRLPRASELQGFHKPGWSPWWSCWHPSGCQRTTSLSSSQWIGHCKWQIQTNPTRAKQKQNEPSSSSVSFFHSFKKSRPEITLTCVLLPAETDSAPWWMWWAMLWLQASWLTSAGKTSWKKETGWVLKVDSVFCFVLVESN